MRAATVHTPGRCPCSACREQLPDAASSGGHKERDASTSREISRASNCPTLLCACVHVLACRRSCLVMMLRLRLGWAVGLRACRPPCASVLLPGVQRLVSGGAAQLSPAPLMHSPPAQPQSTPCSAPAARADFQGTPRRAEYAGGSTPSSPVAAVGAYPGSPLAGSPPPVAYTSPAPGGLKLAMPCVKQGLGGARTGLVCRQRVWQAGQLPIPDATVGSEQQPPAVCLPCHRWAVGVAARCAQPQRQLRRLGMDAGPAPRLWSAPPQRPASRRGALEQRTAHPHAAARLLRTPRWADWRLAWCCFGATAAGCGDGAGGHI